MSRQLVVRVEYVCSVCKNHDSGTKYKVADGAEHPKFNAPEGWRTVDGKWVCPLHRIFIAPSESCVVGLLELSPPHL